MRHPVARVSPIVPEVVELLSKRGVDVDLFYPDEEPTDVSDLRVDHDLYVLKSGAETALSVAGALHALGAAILNPYPVAAVCRDKIIASKLLRQAGVPIPETYAAARADQLAPLLEAGPLVVKPARGSGGRGVCVIRTARELDEVPHDGGPVVAERFQEPDGLDRKIYCIGDEVFGVERVFPARTYEEKVGRPFAVSSELREIARCCGSALGSSLFGFDVVMSAGRPYVVDISSFPGFKGVPDAAVRLAEHIFAAAERAARGEPFVGAPARERVGV